MAFHITVSYPPDLAYTILYSLRGVTGVRHDPVPLILKALEEMQGFRPSHAQLNMELTGSVHDAFHDSSIRAGKAAQILAREISTVPLRYASGIWVAANPRAQPFIHAALREFNPRAAQILARRPKTWWLTSTGIVRGLLGMLFGKDES